MGDELLYRVTAGFVTVETAVGESRASVDIQRGELLPGDVPQEQFDRLLDRGDIALAEPKLETRPRKAAPAKKS